MGVKILGVDTPLDSKAEVPKPLNLRPFGLNPEIPSWDNAGLRGTPEVEIPGQYGPGGFYKPSGVPSIAGPAAGTSLSALPDWRNPFTAPHVDPVTGQPEMLTGQGGIVDRTAPKNPMSWLTMGANLFGNKAKLAALATAEATRATPTANDSVISYPKDYPGSRLLDSPAAYPKDYPTSRLLDPPATSPAEPAVAQQSRTPAAAGPAAAAQQPNLGNYGQPSSAFTTLDYRPNSGPNERNRGSPQATALDLSRLFGGGAPAAPSAAPAAAPTYSQPSIQLIEKSKAPGFMGPLQKGAVWPKEMGPKKRKSSSTSEGGGY